MLRISTCLGNSKPRVVFDVEMAIWKTLFSLASGGMDPFDLLQKLSAELPWESIQAAPPEVSYWFNLGKFHPSISIILLTFFVGALPASTPRNLSLQSSAHIQDLDTSPTSPAPDRRPQVSLENASARTPRNISLQSSAHRVDLDTTPTTSERRPQVSFEDSLASVITEALHRPSTVNPAIISALGSSPVNTHSDHRGHDAERLGHDYDMEDEEPELPRPQGMDDGHDYDMEDGEPESPRSQEMDDGPEHVAEEDNEEDMDDGPENSAQEDEEEDMDVKSGVWNDPREDDEDKLSEPDDEMDEPESPNKSPLKQANTSSLIIKRPRKRRRIATDEENESPEEGNNEDDSLSEAEPGTLENPFVDLFVSKWEPRTVKQFVCIFHCSLLVKSHSFRRCLS